MAGTSPVTQKSSPHISYLSGGAPLSFAWLLRSIGVVLGSQPSQKTYGLYTWGCHLCSLTRLPVREARELAACIIHTSGFGLVNHLLQVEAGKGWGCGGQVLSMVFPSFLIKYVLFSKYRLLWGGIHAPPGSVQSPATPGMQCPSLDQCRVWGAFMKQAGKCLHPSRSGRLPLWHSSFSPHPSRLSQSCLMDSWVTWGCSGGGPAGYNRGDKRRRKGVLLLPWRESLRGGFWGVREAPAASRGACGREFE